MSQSTLHNSPSSGPHVAIIMDGSGRWAQARGLPRPAGHRAGKEAVRRVVQAAPRLGIGTLTLYAFSSDNWQRPENEVAALMQLFEDFFTSEMSSFLEHGIRLSVIGRRDRLPPTLLGAVEAAEAATASGHTLHLRIALDYSGRDAILGAARRQNGSAAVSLEEFSRLLGKATHDHGHSPDVDLLIRTGGEQRLSDFLLWESAYAELLFTKRMWPDFDAADLEVAVKEFHSRERRVGRIPEVAAS